MAGDSFALGRDIRLGVTGVILSASNDGGVGAAAAAAAADVTLAFAPGGRLKAGRVSAAVADARRGLGMQLILR